MNRSIFRLIFVFLLLVILHYTLRPALQWRASVDFMLIAVMLVSVRVSPGVAALLGFSIGLLVDSQSPASLGSSSLGLACVAFVASFLKGSFFADKPAMNAFLFFVGKWAYDVIFIISEGRITAGGTLAQVFFWSPLAAILTAIAGSITLALVQPMLREART